MTYLGASAKTLDQLEQVYDAFRKRDIRRVFFVACGGSSALMYPSKYVLDREARTITSDLYSSNEFIHRNPATLGPDSLVILCSHKGMTPETTEAARFAKSKGALTVSLMFVDTSPLAEASDYIVNYSWVPAGGDDPHPEIMNYAIFYRIIFGLLEIKEGNPKYRKLLDSLGHMKAVLDRARAQYADQARAYARENKDEKWIYTMASGANYGVAYSFAICMLMEMQWIHSHAIHAGEFFHGPFEIVDESVPFILLLGLDETRPLEERALAFLKTYGKKLLALDAKTLDLTGIDPDLRGYIAPIVLNFILRLFAAELAEARNHPLTTRRYMFKVPY